MGSTEDHPNNSLGYDFEDSQTQAQLELIDDLHKLGVSKYLDLPQVRTLKTMSYLAKFLAK